MRGARRGRQRSWDELYRDLAPPLLGYLRAQGAADPEDLVGEVFLEVVRSLHRFAGDEPGFRAWVFTIAHRRLIDARRAAGRRATSAVADEVLEVSLPPVDDAEPLQIRTSTEEVLALLSRLGDDQREVLVLRLVAGLTTAEVAEVTDRSTEAVKGLAKRGLARLRVLLGVGTGDPAATDHAADDHAADDDTAADATVADATDDTAADDPPPPIDEVER